jgi:hypothetical protein
LSPPPVGDRDASTLRASFTPRPEDAIVVETGREFAAPAGIDLARCPPDRLWPPKATVSEEMRWNDVLFRAEWSHMLVLHEDLVARIALLGEG